jgi:hypothetical protein
MLDDLIICDFFLFELLVIVQQPGTKMDRSMVSFVRYGDDHIREIGLCGHPVMLGRDGWEFGMAMVDAQYGPFVVEGILFGGHIVERRNLETTGLVSGFGVVNDEDVNDDASAVPLFPAEQEPAAFVGKRIQCVVYKELFDPGFDDDHINEFNARFIIFY